MDKKIERVAVGMDIKRKPSDDGVFEGYASVFGDLDLGNDIVQRGAFSQSLSTRQPKMLWQHESDKPIGVWEEVREDDHGLYVKGRVLPNVTHGKDALELLKAGVIDSMSIGFRTVKQLYDADTGVRNLLQLDLFEISLVTFPMLPSAKVTAVKSVETERDCERYLRDAGWSRKEAAAMASAGLIFVKHLRDAGHDEKKTEAITVAGFQFVRSLRDAGLEHDEALKFLPLSMSKAPANDDSDSVRDFLTKLSKLGDSIHV